MSPSQHVHIVHPFNGYSGAQRVAQHLLRAMTALRIPVDLRVGFGENGFLTDDQPSMVWLAVNSVPLRKLLYPVWLFWMNMWCLLQAARGNFIWLNTIHALPAATLLWLINPNNALIHLHEATFPKVFHWLLRVAQWRGLQTVCVSDFHRRTLNVDATVLPNCVWHETPQFNQTETSRSAVVFVGAATRMKGFDLFLDVANALGPTFCCRAYLACQSNQLPTEFEAAIRQSGADMHYGKTNPATFFGDAWLTLMLTDPKRATETFSLVAAESVFFGVPVASSGSAVVAELCSDALAFDEPSRRADLIADQIITLHKDNERQRLLGAACARRSADLGSNQFIQNVGALLHSRAIPR
jgi:glycosyltransferase involved in cell wall biosynthesis